MTKPKHYITKTFALSCSLYQLWVIILISCHEYVYYHCNHLLLSLQDPGGIYGETKFPEIGCSYIAPDQCANFTPPTCCERVVGDAGMILRASLVLLIFISLLTVIMGYS